MRNELSTPADRWRSAGLAAALNVVLGYAIIVGLGVHNIPRPDEALKLFTLSDQPPPPPPVVPPPPKVAREVTHKPRDPEGAAAPPARKNTPTEIVAPKVKLPPPPPIPGAPTAGQGTAPKSGAAAIEGPGTGRGGIGNGTGSGLSGNGSGSGGGGEASEPEQVAGSIGNEDYPRSALMDRAQGTVEFSFTVLPDGHIANCRITRSSRTPELDAITCRLALQRFRFRPARDSSGRAIASEVDGEQEWRLGREVETFDR